MNERQHKLCPELKAMLKHLAFEYSITKSLYEPGKGGINLYRFGQLTAYKDNIQRLGRIKKEFDRYRHIT